MYGYSAFYHYFLKKFAGLVKSQGYLPRGVFGIDESIVFQLDNMDKSGYSLNGLLSSDYLFIIYELWLFVLIIPDNDFSIFCCENKLVVSWKAGNQDGFLFS